MSAAEKEVFEDLKTPIGGVPAEMVVQVWDKVAPILARVVKPETGYAVDDVLTELQFARMQLWVIDDFKAVIVTTILQLPLRKTLWIQFVAGDDLDDWMDDWIVVQEGFARYNGCSVIECSGRSGWTKKLCNRYPGYKAVTTNYYKEL